MTLRQRLRFTLYGALGGLLFGVTFWYAWGCRACAKDASPLGIYVFCAALGAFFVPRWAKDHIRPNT